MMKKKVIALLAVATMLLGTVPVSAAPLTSDQGQKEVTGAGTIIDYEKTPKYLVTLPTSRAFDFTIDPNGLLNLEVGSSQAIKVATGTSNIVVASDMGAMIKNESSVPVIVDAKFTVSNTGSAKLVTGESALTNAAGEAVSGAAAYLQIVPSKTMTDSVTEASTKLATGYGLTLTGSNQMSFKLDKAKYVVENTGSSQNPKYTVKLSTAASNFDATVMQVQGKVNKADWMEYKSGATPAALGINAVFSYKECPDTVELVSENAVHGLVSGQAAVAPTFASTAVGKFTINPGSGDEEFVDLISAKSTYKGVVKDLVALGKLSKSVDASTGVITYTMDSKYVTSFATEGSTVKCDITYKNASGDKKKTATVIIKVK